MTAPQADIHLKTVEHWLRTNAENLSSIQKVLLLEKAILAVEKRACSTLSIVTLMVVLDRILHQTREDFPILAKATLEKKSLSFKDVDKVQNAEETIAALTFLLVELLRVLGRLTANILTMPLHIELNKVTSDDSGES
jgi:hypothetical protein